MVYQETVNNAAEFDSCSSLTDSQILMSVLKDDTTVVRIPCV